MSQKKKRATLILIKLPFLLGPDKQELELRLIAVHQAVWITPECRTVHHHGSCRRHGLKTTKLNDKTRQ